MVSSQRKSWFLGLLLVGRATGPNVRFPACQTEGLSAPCGPAEQEVITESFRMANLNPLDSVAVGVVKTVFFQGSKHFRIFRSLVDTR